MNLTIFDDSSVIEVWPSFRERVLGGVKRGLQYPAAYRTLTTTHESYDTYIRRENPIIAPLPIEYVADLLCLQSEGQTGAFSLTAAENVIFLEGHNDSQMVLRIIREESYYRKGYIVWKGFGIQCPIPGVHPDWGSYRPAGTQYIFPS